MWQFVLSDELQSPVEAFKEKELAMRSLGMMFTLVILVCTLSVNAHAQAWNQTINNDVRGSIIEKTYESCGTFIRTAPAGKGSCLKGTRPW